jgi:hypothetical protein
MGNKYVRTITGAVTRCAEFVEIPNKEAGPVVDAVFTR